MFGQIKMEIPWYINWHRLISRERNGKPRMISGQFLKCLSHARYCHHCQHSLFFVFTFAHALILTVRGFKVLMYKVFPWSRLMCYH